MKSYLFLGGFLDFPQIGGHEAPAPMELQGEKKRGEGDFVGMGWFAAACLPSPPVRAKFLRVQSPWREGGVSERDRQREKRTRRCFPLSHGGCFISRETQVAGCLSSGTETTYPAFQTESPAFFPEEWKPPKFLWKNCVPNRPSTRARVLTPLELASSLLCNWHWSAHRSGRGSELDVEKTVAWWAWQAAIDLIGACVPYIRSKLCCSFKSDGSVYMLSCHAKRNVDRFWLSLGWTVTVNYFTNLPVIAQEPRVKYIYQRISARNGTDAPDTVFFFPRRIVTA